MVAYIQRMRPLNSNTKFLLGTFASAHIVVGNTGIALLVKLVTLIKESLIEALVSAPFFTHDSLDIR